MTHPLPRLETLSRVGLALLLLGACVDPPGVYLGPPGTALTHVVVEVQRGAVQGEVWRFRSVVTLDGVTRESLLPEDVPSRSVEFPATYKVVARERRGTVSVALDALGEDGRAVGRASGEVALAEGRGVTLLLTLAVPCDTELDCDDGVFCNGVERCAGRTCAAGAVACPPSIHACVDITCDEQARACHTAANDDACAGEGARYCDVALGCLPGRVEPPGLLGEARLSPEVATVGARLLVAFTATEPLAADPLVWLEAGSRRVSMQVDEEGTRRAQSAYAFWHVVDGSEPAGRRGVTVDMVDLSGATVAGLSAGAVTLDYAAPAVVGQPVLDPRVLRAGAVAALELSVTEDLRAPPEVRMGGVATPPGNEGAAWVLVRSDGTTHGFTYTAAGTEEEGEHGLWLRAVDKAGNDSGWLAVGGVELDFTAPGVTQAVVDPGLARPGQVVLVTVTLDEVSGGEPALVGGKAEERVVFELVRRAQERLTFQRVVSDGEDGPWSLVVSGVVDAAGNQMQEIQVGTLVVDGTPPGLTGYAQDKDVVNGADSLVVEFGVTEALRGEPEVFLADLPMQRSGSGVSPYRYTASLTGTGMQGRLDVRVGMVDVAGNAALVSAGVVQVDAVAPELTDVVFSPPVARLGITAYLTVTPSERLLQPPVLGWDPVTGDPGFGQPIRSGQAYVYSLPVTAGVRSGVYRLSTVGLVDVAGNEVVADAQGVGMAVDFSVDSDQPRVTGLVVDGTRFSAQPGYNQVVVWFGASEPLPEVGGVEVTVGARPAECEATVEGHACTYLVLGDEDEGTTLVNVTVTDAAGNVGFKSASVVLDFTPPRLVPGSSRIQLTPPVGCPMSEVAALTVGSVARVQFALDEPVSAHPLVEAENGGPLALALESQVGTAFIYRLAIDATEYPQGAYQVTVAATDLVGNPGTHSLPGAGGVLAVDTVPPASPDVDTPGAVEYQRVPWGFDEHRDGVYSPGTFRVAWGAGATDGDTVWVTASDHGNPATGSEIGSARVNPGSGGVVELKRLDREYVHLTAYDGACNPSPTVRVRDVQWTATMGYKVPGRTEENPHLLTVTPVLAVTRVQDALAARSQSLEQVPLVTAVDSQAAVQVGAPVWRVLRPSAANPAARTHHAMVYDSARGQVVLFGGAVDLGWVTVQDTWEWDVANGAWRERTPEDKPSPRRNHGMAYDTARRRVVLFGGMPDTGWPLADTWEWDGERGTWEERHVTGPVPLGRNGHAMSYDSGRGMVVLHGGMTISSTRLDDTWEWDGTTGSWRDVTPAEARPTARNMHAMAYDARSRKVVMFGGMAPGNLDDTWEWDGGSSTWTERVPVGAKPRARHGHVMAYDDLGESVVLMGGSYAGTWAWNSVSGTWTERTAPGVQPTVRNYSGMACVTGTGRSIVFGGIGDSGETQDTWEWDGVARTWTERTPGGGTIPVTRSRHAMVYDGARGEVMIHAGEAGPSNRWDTWGWNDPRSAWMDRSPPPGWTPVARRSHALAYDVARRKVVLFGGRGYTTFQDTWEWDGVAGSWTQRTPTGAIPIARFGHAMAYDAARGRVVLFGGPGDRADTWEWVGSTGTWVERVPTGDSPGLRYGHAMVYDEATARVVLHGGWGMTGALGDLWEWDGGAGAWNELTPAGPVPEARCYHGMTYDGARRKVLVHGGRNASTAGMDDLWEWDGTDGSWTQRFSQGALPGVRYEHGVAHDSARGTMVMFGGHGSGSSLHSWDPGVDARPGQVLEVRLAGIGMSLAAPVQVRAFFLAGGVGRPGGVVTPGTELVVWDQGAWKVVATNADHADAPGTIEWTSSEASIVSRLVRSSSLDFAVRPAAVNGTGEARVSVDYAEVTVGYRLP